MPVKQYKEIIKSYLQFSPDKPDKKDKKASSISSLLSSLFRDDAKNSQQIEISPFLKEILMK